MADIIETKIRPPQVRKDRLSRSHSEPQLTQSALDAGLACIVAPAGSGKSTVLIELHEAFQAAGFRCFWLSLEAADNNPSEFARYLTAALSPLDRPVAEKGLAFLKSGASDNLNDYLDALIRTVASKTEKFALFVDDFQFLTHKDLLRFWNRLLAHAPSSMCTVLASRSPLPLDLSKRRTSGGLLELSQADLNLDAAQIQQFMKQLHSLELPLASAQLLHDRTEGWMVGLQLAGIAMTSAPDRQSDVLDNFSAKDRNLKEYLFETVYNLQDQEIKDFLLQTAPLSKMCASLCNAITGKLHGEALIERIEAANLFLIPLDREGNWYRYHHLFSEFLRHELGRKHRSELTRICNRAADWCIEQGHLTEAIQYCLDGSDFEKAADLIAEHSEAVAIYQGDHARIYDWAQRLPKAYHYRRPEILLHHAWSRAFTHDSTGTAVALSDELESLLKHSEDPHWDLSPQERHFYIDLAKVVRMIAMTCAEQGRACIEACDGFLKDRGDASAIVIASTQCAKAHSLYLLKNLTGTVRAATDTYAHGSQAGSVYALVWADIFACMSHIELGQLSSADDNARRSLLNAGPASEQNSQCAAMAALMAAEVALQRCDFESAQQHLMDGRVLASISNPPILLHLALKIEARLMAWTGSLNSARESLQRGQENALRTDQPRLYYLLVAEEVDLLLFSGKFQLAQDSLRRTGMLNLDHPQINSDNRDSIVECVRLTEARTRLAEGRTADALQLLGTIDKSARQSGRLALRQHVRALKAIGLWKSGENRSAVRELDKAISLATPENHVYPLFDAGNGLLPILEDICKKRTPGVLDDTQTRKHAFEQRLIELLSGNPTPKPGDATQTKPASVPAGLAEPLTGREMEILRLISAGLGNKQLADEMLISLSTAKWHVHNIFEKLGVRSRAAAAAYARKHDLI